MRCAMCRLIVAASVLAVGSSLGQAASVADAVRALRDDDGACIVTAMTQADLGNLQIDGQPATKESRIAAIEQAGLHVFPARGENVLALADLRPRGEPQAGLHRDIEASMVLAALPADVVTEQIRRGPEPGPTRFSLDGLPEAAAKMVERVAPRDLEPRRYGWVGWQTEQYYRDRSTSAVIERAPFPNRYFWEPPVAFGPRNEVEPDELLWLLWEFGHTEWGRAQCPLIPQGEGTLGGVLEALLDDERALLRDDPTAWQLADSPVQVLGQPSSVGGLLWALRICCGLGCREVDELPPIGELFVPPWPEDSIAHEISTLPARGFVSPLRTEVVRAMLAESDYPELIPLHAYWRVRDLPPFYQWIYTGPDRPMHDDLGLLWLRFVCIQLGTEGGNAGGRFAAELPVF